MDRADHGIHDRARAERAALRPTRAHHAGRADDGRLASPGGEVKPGLSRLAWSFLEALRDAVIGDAAGRRSIAEGLGVPARTVEKWLAPSEHNVPRLDHALQLLTREDLLTPAGRRILHAWLDKECGRHTVDAADVGVDEAPLPDQVLQLAARCGAVAALVEEARKVGSRGGREISRGEARAMLGPAREAVREGLELVATLEEVAGARRAPGRGIDVTA